MIKKNDCVHQDYPPHWCKYCCFLWCYRGNNACGYDNLLRMLLMGPKIVKFDDTCKHFEYADKYKNQKVR